MAFECPRRSSPPSPMFDADTGCIATDPAPSARRRFRSKTGIENLPANEHAQETPHTPSPTRTTRRIQSGCAGSRPRLRDGMPGSPSQHIDITRAKWIPYLQKRPPVLQKNRKVQKPLIKSDNFFILVGSSLQSPCIEAVIAKIPCSRKNSLFPPNSPLHRARGDRTPRSPAMAGNAPGFRSSEFRLTAKRALFPAAWPSYAMKRLLRRGGWLGRQDSNLRSRDQSPMPYRLATPQQAPATILRRPGDRQPRVGRLG